jgi:hypothetical protein
MNKEIDFHKGMQQMRMDRVLIGASTQLGKELVYSFKVAMGLHQVPENVNIVRINPII